VYHPHFTHRDDQLLRDIVASYPEELTPEDWEQVRNTLDKNFSARQVIERW
jgi:hypothetical protein